MEMCACGQPLHYSSPKLYEQVERMIQIAGDPLVTVTTPDGRWRVPRHYIALHGLKASELPTLGPALGFEKVK